MEPSQKPNLLSNAIPALILLLAALALRITTFGDTNLFVDDELYALIGQRMHDGGLPYVDIWDRKPMGLFLISYAIAAISPTMLAWQVAAWLFAAATACVIHLIVRQFSNAQGGLLAGLTYLLLLGPLDGYGGQAPVFYNLFVATAAWLISRESEHLARGMARWPIALAMTLCGLAIGVKQTALFESGFFGLYVLAALWRGGLRRFGLARLACGYMALGALPMLAFSAWYAAIGHWPEYWHAMVTSNLSKGLPEARNVWFQLSGIGMRVLPTVAIAAIALWQAESATRRFLFGWLLAALVGFAATGQFFMHYTLPVLVPLCVTAGLFLARGSIGRICFIALLLWAFVWYHPTDLERRRHSLAGMEAMVSAIRKGDDGGGLFVYDGPPYLYALTGQPLVSPLTFPDHLNHLTERDVSHLRTDAEIDRILAARPSVVAFSINPRNKPVNHYAHDRVRDYIARHCVLLTTAQSHASGLVFPISIHGRCRGNQGG